MTTQLKGERYIYALMAIDMCKVAKTLDDKDFIKVGNDNGIRGGFNFERIFKLQSYEGKTLLIEKRSSASCVDFTRSYEYREYANNIVIDTPTGWEH